MTAACLLPLERWVALACLPCGSGVLCAACSVNRVKEQRLQAARAPLFRWCHVLTSHPLFDNFIIAVVVANTAALSVDHYGISDDMTDRLTAANTVFSALFALEMALKLLGARPFFPHSHTCARTHTRHSSCRSSRAAEPSLAAGARVAPTPPSAPRMFPAACRLSLRTGSV
jgi:hypothetical protein